MSVRTPDDVRARVVEMFLAGTPLERVAAAVGMSRQCAARVVRAAGHDSARGQKVRPDADVTARVMAMYHAGEDVCDIAKAVGIGRTTCFNLLRREGAPWRAGQSSKRRPWTAEEEAELRRLYVEERLSGIEIGKRIQRCDQHVGRKLRELGLVNGPGMRPVYTADHGYFRVIDTEEKAYWLGFISADGCVMRRTLTVALKESDRGHLHKLAAAIRYDGPLHDRVSRCRGGHFPQVGLTVTSAEFAADLPRHGVTPRKSLTLQPWDGPEHLLPAYWRGLVDGDGHIRITKRGHPECGLTGSAGVVGAFCRYVREKCGYEPSVWPQGRAFQARVNNTEAAKQLLTMLYGSATVWLDRKKAVAEEIMAMSFRTAKTKRFVGYTPRTSRKRSISTAPAN